VTSGRAGTGAWFYRKERAWILAHSDVCWLCGHPGALTADHVVPPKLWPLGTSQRTIDGRANLRPAHGTMGNRGPHNRCPTCRKLCNQSRGSRLPQQPRRQSRDWFGSDG
jgi:5-methylcytosine-specific restriction endonuclease McrA